eukprot:3990109-Alexandrium_andersonii.AAC.1
MAPRLACLVLRHATGMLVEFVEAGLELNPLLRNYTACNGVIVRSSSVVLRAGRALAIHRGTAPPPTQ